MLSKYKEGGTDCVCIILMLLSVVNLDGICQQTRHLFSDEIHLLLYLVQKQVDFVEQKVVDLYRKYHQIGRAHV